MTKIIDKYFKKILTAPVYDLAQETPLERASNLSKRFHNEIFLKREDLQPVFSFKLRGAYNKMARLSDEQKQKGVVAASAGNHAQGVALSAKRLKTKATIVMPKNTPQIKVNAVKNLGAHVVLFGDVFNDAEAHAKKLSEDSGLVFIHPYDDPDVIAGQGTIGMEILRQLSDDIEAVFVCVGGGGMLAGVSAYIKALKPKIKVIGVEPIDSDCCSQALKANKRIKLDWVNAFADGVAVLQMGKETFRICQHTVDGMIQVTTDEICAAIKDVFEDTRSLMEPAGALGVAGMTKYIQSKNISGKRFVAITSGANINFHRLRHVSERAELGEMREAIVGVTIPEEPGSFKKLVQLLGKRHITEFNYRLNDHRDAHVFLGAEIYHPGEVKELILKLKNEGYKAVDLSDNELAKLHLRHMVGGHYNERARETLYRFEFPERQGALSDFLKVLSPEWNISLFHYRNHGTDYGRVLVGLEVAVKDENKLKRSLDELGYRYWCENQNLAVKLFLG